MLVSADGGNFAEAACWRPASRSEVSYEDVIMFDVPQMVKSLTIVMKAPMPWGYFGFLHGAAMAVDGNPGTFWASKLDDTKGPIEFIIDFGEEQQLQFIEIEWEFPARGFAVSLSVDGDHFNEAFATDANILEHFRSGLGSKVARKLRITMYEVRVRRLSM